MPSGEGGAEKGRVGRLVAAAGVGIALIAGAVGLLFQVDPGLQPCLGGADASFTAAPVFPHVGHRQYYLETGLSGALAAKLPDDSGAEVSYSYRIDSLRGRTLTVRWTLLSIERDGTLGAVVPGYDRLVDRTIPSPDCSTSGSSDLFVPIPNHSEHYRVLLELERDSGLTDRIALSLTAAFHG